VPASSIVIPAATLFGAKSDPLALDPMAKGRDAALAALAQRRAAQWSALFNRQFGKAAIARRA